MKTHAQRIGILIVLASISILLSGCKRKSDEPMYPAMLESGKGAVLVTFYRHPEANRETWLSQATLVGPWDTKVLPRISLADQQAILIMNVPPGAYSMVAQAWLRKMAPHAGGSLSGIEIAAGKLTIVQGNRLKGGERFDPVEPLVVLDTVPWKLKRTEEFHEYIAGVIQSSVKG